MSRWFRFYDMVLDDPKVQRLPPHLFKTWVNILCMASQGKGVLPSTDDISFKLRMSAHDTQSQIDELIGLGLVDIRPDKALEPHNWSVRQFASDVSTERVRKYRKRHAKRQCNGDETLHETAPDTEQIQIQKQNIPPKRGAGKFINPQRENHDAFNAAIAKLEGQP